MGKMDKVTAEQAAPELLAAFNFGLIEFDAWIEQRRRPDGDYDLIGMGRRTEYDARTGVMVSNKVEPTGARGWAPAEFIEPPRATWWRRLFCAA